MSDLNTTKLLTSIFHQKPSFARDLSIGWEQLGLPKAEAPEAKILVKPEKIDKSLLQPFDSISSTISNRLARLGLKTNGVVIVPPHRIREIESFMMEKDVEWQEALKEVEKKYDAVQAALWEKTVTDKNIQGVEWKDKFLAYVHDRMPSKDEFVARHERFQWGIVPYFQGTVDMEGFDRVAEGLDFVRQGAIGSLIAEINRTSVKLMEKVEKGNVQAGSQKLMLEIIEKVSEFSFLNPRLTDISLEMHRKFSPLLNGVESINDKDKLKEISILLKPLMDQHHIDDVIFYEESLFGEVKKVEKTESAIDIIRRREQELSIQTEKQKEANSKKLKEIRALVNPEIAEELKVELDNAHSLTPEEIKVSVSQDSLAKIDSEIENEEEAISVEVEEQSSEFQLEMAPALF